MPYDIIIRDATYSTHRSRAQPHIRRGILGYGIGLSQPVGCIVYRYIVYDYAYDYAALVLVRSLLRCTALRLEWDSQQVETEQGLGVLTV